MLIRFRVSNFRSFCGEQEFSLVAARLKGDENPIVYVSENLSVLRCAGIYGANASGKSNLLRAFGFMAVAVEEL